MSCAPVAGDAEAQRTAATGAQDIARREGWVNRVRQVERELGQDAPGKRAAPAPTGTSTGGADVMLARQMDALLRVTLASSSSLDPLEQSRAILDELVRLLSAERAFLFVAGGGGLTMRAGRTAKGDDLSELRGYSSTVVARAFHDAKAIVVTGTDEGEALGSTSAVAHNLRSIIAAPLLLRDRVLGVVYLDSSIAKGIFTEEDIAILQALANHIAIALETGRAMQVEIEKEAMKKDLEVTGAVQSLLLPRERSIASEHLRLLSHYRPAAHSGGDWWFHCELPDRRRLILLGDVSGHGVGAAMVTAVVAASFRTLHEGLFRDGASAFELGALLERLNQTFVDVCSSEYSMTLSVLEVSADASKVTYVNLGGPPIFLLRRDGAVQGIARPGSIIGTGALELGRADVALEPGDRLFLFSDGAFELPRDDAGALGIRGLARLVQRLAGETAGAPLDALDAALRRFFDESLRAHGQMDDLTYLLVERRESAATGAR
jgi:serine phosphatase RsbU (regulator of sigma subunit)